LDKLRSLSEFRCEGFTLFPAHQQAAVTQPEQKKRIKTRQWTGAEEVASGWYWYRGRGTHRFLPPTRTLRSGRSLESAVAVEPPTRPVPPSTSTRAVLEE